MLALLLGISAGLALGLVGGGGSILTVPLLVGPLGVPAREATTMSLVIVGIAAAWASLSHARRGNVLWSRAVLFGAVGIAGTAVGGYLNRSVEPRVLLAGFVVVMIAAAVATWRRAGSATEAAATANPGATRDGTAERDRTAVEPRRAADERALVPGGPAAHPLRVALAAVGDGGRLRMLEGEASAGRASLADRVRARAAACPLLDVGPFVLAAVGVGLLTGFFGVGGGFLIVPALVLVVRLPMAQAVGTSLPVIAINSGTALLGHLGTGAAIDPAITALFTLGALGGGLVGGVLSTRLPAATLGRAFALVVLVLAAYLALQVV